MSVCCELVVNLRKAAGRSIKVRSISRQWGNITTGSSVECVPLTLANTASWTLTSIPQFTAACTCASRWFQVRSISRKEGCRFWFWIFLRGTGRDYSVSALSRGQSGPDLSARSETVWFCVSSSHRGADGKRVKTWSPTSQSQSCFASFSLCRHPPPPCWIKLRLSLRLNHWGALRIHPTAALRGGDVHIDGP